MIFPIHTTKGFLFCYSVYIVFDIICVTNRRRCRPMVVTAFQTVTARRYHYFEKRKSSPSDDNDDDDDNDSTATSSTINAAADGTGASASDLRSLKFSNLKKEQEPQLLCNFLMELGACSTSIIDSDRGTNNEQAIFDEFDMESMTRTAVTTHCWNHCNVTALFPASVSFDWIMDLVRDVFPDLRYNDADISTVENKDWVLHVQKSWDPVVLPPFVLRFPWHNDQMVKEAVIKKNKENNNNESAWKTVELELQGGIAFGTGEHPTTQLCLEFVSDTIEQQKINHDDDDGMLLMDYGTGSGVLGMAYCKLDSSARAIGVDIDVDAVNIANANAEMNDVDMKSYLSDLVQTSSDDESTSIRLKAYSSKDGQQCETIPKQFNQPIYDACVANILAAPLVSLAPTLSNLLKPGAPLGLSGIMTSQSSMIQSAYDDYFDDVKVKKELSGWVLVTGTRKKI